MRHVTLNLSGPLLYLTNSVQSIRALTNLTPTYPQCFMVVRIEHYCLKVAIWSVAIGWIDLVGTSIVTFKNVLSNSLCYHSRNKRLYGPKLAKILKNKIISTIGRKQIHRINRFFFSFLRISKMPSFNPINPVITKTIKLTK